MRRRRFIRLAGGGSLALAALGPAGCAPSGAYQAWQGPAPGLDTRAFLLSYAILAPSSHNTQPWLVDLSREGEITLLADHARALPEVDPDGFQLFISQGTFIEMLIVAAREKGLETRVSYFPQGLGPDRPVAALRFKHNPRQRPDPLFSALLNRRTNRREYAPLDQQGLAEAFGAMAAQADAVGCGLGWAAGGEVMGELAGLVARGMAIEVSGRARNQELSDWFRLGRGQVASHRDGLDLASGGATGIKRLVAETFFIDRDEMADPDGAFAKTGAQMARTQADTASAFGWITTPADSRVYQVLAGRAYARLNLLAARLGLAQQPMMVVLEKYPDLDEVRQRALALLTPGQDSGVAQMFFRLGLAKPTPHSPRRRVESLVVRGAGG